tara:strand:+ start:4790 stop:5008 length:219 start_codon:yes stop_codon:yes gene_type:complete
MKIINNWNELSKVPDSKTHSLDIEDYCGWLIHKDSGDRSYLSTHTFYGNEFENSTIRLQGCGFDVQLKNWDE